MRKVHKYDLIVVALPIFKSLQVHSYKIKKKKYKLPKIQLTQGQPDSFHSLLKATRFIYFDFHHWLLML